MDLKGVLGAPSLPLISPLIPVVLLEVMLDAGRFLQTVSTDHPTEPGQAHSPSRTPSSSAHPGSSP